MTVQIFKGKGARSFYVRLVAANGRVLSISESYVTRWNAKRAARRIFPGLPVREVAE